MSGGCRFSAVHSLVRAAAEKDMRLDAEDIIHAYTLTGEPSPRRMLRILHDHGCTARLLKISWRELLSLGKAYPAIAMLRDGGAITVLRPVIMDENAPLTEDTIRIRIHDPCAAPEEGPDGFLDVSREDFLQKWTGQVILFKKDHALTDPDQPFGLRWFIPELLKNRQIFSEVALAAFFIYAISLVVPIFFQVVIDKVLVHEARNTLLVLGAGVTAGLAFEWLVRYIQRHLLLHATSRMDVRVGVRAFGKLMRLPLDFFEYQPAGVITKNLQQTKVIREFMTGQLFMTLLDSLSLFVFVPVIFYYSWRLALLVLGMSALVALILFIIIPIYRSRIERLYAAEGQMQSVLFETVKGVHTVKSLALEPVRQKQWDEALSNTVNRQFEVGKTANVAHALTGFLEKLMTIAIIWYGAYLVFSGSMTVGALVAFNMLAARVIGPLVQLASLIHRFQEARLSVRKLGEIMNSPDEQKGLETRKLPEKFDNSITFKGVSFTYPSGGLAAIASRKPALVDINFRVPPNREGWIIGVVGRSGSGKTTLTRLMQGFHLPDDGIIRMGGHDLKELDLAALRRNIGVVLQDSFLFRGTILDNIAMRKPSATREEIEQASWLAGAHEFIEKLPRGYATMLEEGGVNLSGGQRQRLSIARALLANPRFMIFDEATSSLDPLTERIFRDNLKRIAAGRTLVIVSHRLSTIRDSNMIIVLNNGRIVGYGTHEKLLSGGGDGCDIYQQLWKEQTS